MDRNEILLRLKKISGIEIPTEEQEKDIDELIQLFDQDDEREDLRTRLADAEKERDEIKERYRKRFWGEDEEKPKPKPRKSESTLLTLDEII